MSPRNATQRNRSADSSLHGALAIGELIALRLGARLCELVLRARLALLSCFAFATRRHRYHAYIAGWPLEAPAIGSRHMRAAELPSY